jgi:putative peptide modification system cyclase
MVGRTLSHFRILEQLGAGGMGEVYLAEDLKLGRKVALKTLLPEMAGSRDRLVRFEREARAVAALNHPNIVTLHSVEEVDGVHFFTMEWIQGETLAKVIRPGGLPLATLLSIAIPLAEALGAAHDQGIIHRDLKPKNIMVTPGGRVKILDFGVAKLRAGGDSLAEPPAETALTQEGMVFGTVSYMSPEQIRTDRIDHRSDLFSLGIILYEMATGIRPFAGQSTGAILASVLCAAPRKATDLNPELPQRLGTIISCCLEKDPEQRFQTAHDLHRELMVLSGHAGEEESPTLVDLPSAARAELARLAGTSAPSGAMGSMGAMEAAPPAPALRPPWKRRLRTALLVSIPLALALLSLGVWRSRQAFSFQARDSIVLGAFQNLTSEAVLDDSLEMAFRMGLEQSRYAHVLPASQVRAALARMEQAPTTRLSRDLGVELCQREGSRALIQGTVAQIGGAYSLSAEIIDPRTDRTVFTESETAKDRDHLLDALESLTRGIRSHLGESLAQIQETSVPLAKVTTRNLQALKSYSLGIQSIAQGEEDQAVELLQRAIELDPEFATAHAKLGTVYNNFEMSRKKATEHWVTALRFGDRLTGYEKLYLEGSRAWDGEPVEMLRIWSTLRALYPEQIVGHQNVGCVSWWFLNDFSRAEEAFGSAARISDPLHFISFNNLGSVQMGTGRLAEALKSFETSWKLEHNPLNSGLAEIYAALGRPADAEAFLARVQATSSGRQKVEALCRRAELQAAFGKLRQAAATTEEVSGLAAGNQRRLLRIELMSLAMQERGPDRARFAELLRHSVEADLRLFDSEPERLGISPVAQLALLGKVAARSSQGDLARRILDRLRPLRLRRGANFDEGYRRALEAEVALAAGRPQEALAILRAALPFGNLFQVHESLARAEEAAGDLMGASREVAWMQEHRGQAYAEWIEPYNKMFNLFDTALAPFHLGRLSEAQGRPAEAVDHYRRFLDAWKDADPDLPVLLEARRRLSRLQAGPSRAGAAGSVGTEARRQGVAVH